MLSTVLSPPQYIKGYIDVNKLKFYPNPKFSPKTNETIKKMKGKIEKDRIEITKKRRKIEKRPGGFQTPEESIKTLEKIERQMKQTRTKIDENNIDENVW